MIKEITPIGMQQNGRASMVRLLEEDASGFTSLITLDHEDFVKIAAAFGHVISPMPTRTSKVRTISGS